jgi:hypothetical protein
MQQNFVTKFFYQENLLVFQVLVPDAVGNYVLHSQYSDYEDYQQAISLLRAQHMTARAKETAKKEPVADKNVPVTAQNNVKKQVSHVA